MFDHPLFLPIALGVIVLGLFYLFVSDSNKAQDIDPKAESRPRQWHVQCPKCQRWKKMQPIRRVELINVPEALEVNILPGTQHRFLHDYKCKFCGHSWQERYSA